MKNNLSSSKVGHYTKRTLAFLNDGDESVSGFIKSLLAILMIVVAIRTFAFESFRIPSGSMYPTNYIGDFLFVSKYKYGYSHYSIMFSPKIFEGRIFASEPERGEVAVFRFPKDTSVDYIKRVIGMPGDKIQMRGGILHINGKAMNLERIEDFMIEDQGHMRKVEQYVETLPNGVKHKILKHETFGMGRADNTAELIVPAGHYFMMGDNRDRSMDSRYINDVGFIPLENFIGRAEVVYMSIDWSWPWSLRLDRCFTRIR
jgi:signal peptidase I